LTGRKLALLSLLIVLAAVGTGALAYRWRDLAAWLGWRSGDPLTAALRTASAIPSPRAEQCGRCHPAQLETWKESQHAWANRLLSPERDGPAFADQGLIEGPRQTELRGRDGHLEIVTLGPEGKSETYRPAAVIAIEPLRQYLVPFPGGRLQVLDVAFDPSRRDWFNVVPGEHRQPHEWGFWTNRGMNWNSQCAGCHMTGFRKGYDIASDSYRTSWDEMGIACAQCHGPMPTHAVKGGPPAADERIPRTRGMDTCAPCHARREELTASFRPGESFDDHYRLILANARGIYHPDGQVREENFEYGSFLMSRMSRRGVTCLDCHDPHSGKLRLPAEDNRLCLSCHAAPGQRGARVVDPLAHGRHKPGSPGAACVGCHMPATVYMARDARRDHGFTSPDPMLTKELGIPNACNRCHMDQTLQWARHWTDRWYTDRVRRPVRERTRSIARAQGADGAVGPDLIALVRREENPAWRAALIALLAPWSDQTEVAETLLAALRDADALVRAAAVRAFEGRPSALAPILALRKDPVRLVRLDAMLIGLGLGTPVTEGRDELNAYLTVGSDQPAGALRQAQVALAEGRHDEAERWIRAAVRWDGRSAVLHHTLGRVLNARGKNAEAEAALAKAAELEPANAEHVYTLALLYAETGRVPDALAALKKTVAIDPRFGRAWYNLGLAYAERNLPDEALDAIRRAEVLMSASPDPPHALASIYARLGNARQARAAAERAAHLRRP